MGGVREGGGVILMLGGKCLKILAIVLCAPKALSCPSMRAVGGFRVTVPFLFWLPMVPVYSGSAKENAVNLIRFCYYPSCFRNVPFSFFPNCNS
jgi:hypothetical protein